MSPERAFHADLNMAKVEIISIDSSNALVKQRSLFTFLATAVSHVVASPQVTARRGEVQKAVHAVVLEIGKIPMGCGNESAVAAAKAKLVEELECLRIDLHHCPPSPMNRILGLT